MFPHSDVVTVVDQFMTIIMGYRGFPIAQRLGCMRCGDGTIVMTVSQMMVDKEFQKLLDGTAHNFMCPKRNYLTAEQHPIIYRVTSLCTHVDLT